MNYLYVAIGGGSGACLRFLISNLIVPYFPSFPYGTMIANLMGCFLAGYSFIFVSEHSLLKPLIGIGFLGGLTTFSSFSLEIVQMIEQKKYLPAALHWGVGAFFCLLLTFLGLIIGSKIYSSS